MVFQPMIWLEMSPTSHWLVFLMALDLFMGLRLDREIFGLGGSFRKLVGLGTFKVGEDWLLLTNWPRLPEGGLFLGPSSKISEGGAQCGNFFYHSLSEYVVNFCCHFSSFREFYPCLLA